MESFESFEFLESFVYFHSKLEGKLSHFQRISCLIHSFIDNLYPSNHLPPFTPTIVILPVREQRLPAWLRICTSRMTSSPSLDRPVPSPWNRWHVWPPTGTHPSSRAWEIRYPSIWCPCGVHVHVHVHVVNIIHYYWFRMNPSDP